MLDICFTLGLTMETPSKWEEGLSQRGPPNPKNTNFHLLQPRGKNRNMPKSEMDSLQNQQKEKEKNTYILLKQMEVKTTTGSPSFFPPFWGMPREVSPF